MRFTRLRTINGLDRGVYLAITPYLAAYAVFVLLMSLAFPAPFLVASRWHLAPLVVLCAANITFSIRARQGQYPERLNSLRTIVNLCCFLVLYYFVDPSTSALWLLMFLPILGQLANAEPRGLRLHFGAIVAVFFACFLLHMPPWQAHDGWHDWLFVSVTRFASVLLIGGFSYGIRRKSHAQNRSLLAAYNRLAQSQKHIAQTERFAVLGEMSAGVAHEINNGLMAMLCGLSDLGDFVRNREPSWAAMDKHLERMNRSAERIERVAKQLQLLAVDPRRVRPQRFDLRDAIRSAVDLTRSQLESLGIAIHVDEVDAPLLVNGHQGELSQLLLNLLVNSRDALEGAKGPREIRIGLKRADARVTLSVADTGPGLPEEVVHRIFRPFVTTKPSGRATGLGLSVAYGIVKRHGGAISFETAPEKGTTFSIDLPLASRAAAA